VQWIECLQRVHYRCDLSSLRIIGSVGEPINPEAWKWYHAVVGGGRCAVVDTWWQVSLACWLWLVGCSRSLTNIPRCCIDRDWWPHAYASSGLYTAETWLHHLAHAWCCASDRRQGRQGTRGSLPRLSGDQVSVAWTSMHHHQLSGSSVYFTYVLAA
jgi:hypothetical protein